MATTPSPDIVLQPLTGDGRPAEAWVTTFHLAMVVLDPFTYESSWIIDTAARVLANFRGADCRPCWLVTGTAEQAQEFLGPMADEFLTFVDPDREFVTSLELEHLPAFVHLNQALQPEAVAEGWEPAEWREVAENLSGDMKWSRPVIPAPGDPSAYPGTPAQG